MSDRPPPPPPPPFGQQIPPPPPPAPQPHLFPGHGQATLQATPKVDGLAVASLVLGIVWVYWIGSILAIIFGAVALRRIKRSQGWRTGKGMAIAGLVLGIVGVAILVLTIVVAVSVGFDDGDNAGAALELVTSTG